ncbi:MAG: hypothetical protein IJ936_00030, partial [Peptococcaceae bacterium]|nr:hypothetical protein [Peptococcaceae bacterium]
KYSSNRSTVFVKYSSFSIRVLSIVILVTVEPQEIAFLSRCASEFKSAVSVLLGCEIPANCEGAPAYEIFTERV